MIDREILKKVRKIELSTRDLVNEVFGGEYHSVFKGRGMEFAEVREYLPGDDIRSIDWNVTARSGTPHVKLFDEERELTVMLMVDASASGAFGTTQAMKRRVAAEISALLAFAATQNNDKVGLIIFTDEVELYVPPRKGRPHVLRVIREVLSHDPAHSGTSLTDALEFLGRVQKRRAVVFLLTDFLDSGWERMIQLNARRHDLVSLTLQDPWEMDLPNLGLLQVHDAETGSMTVLPTRNRRFRRAYHLQALERRQNLEQFFKKNGLDYLHINTGDSYVEPLISFFRRRAARIRR